VLNLVVHLIGRKFLYILISKTTNLFSCRDRVDQQAVLVGLSGKVRSPVCLIQWNIWGRLYKTLNHFSITIL
jgi:hypothetical protein